jgi:hypothetical protein
LIAIVGGIYFQHEWVVFAHSRGNLPNRRSFIERPSQGHDNTSRKHGQRAFVDCKTLILNRFHRAFSKLRFESGLIMLVALFGHEARTAKVLWLKDIVSNARRSGKSPTASRR